MNLLATAEGQRLTRADADGWRAWGPYLSERQWGTVREDYSPDGTAWNYLPHDHARSRAYRWGEDGIAGFADEKLRWCLSLALWNGRDPILKERMFGLTNDEGNHGEDVKECWWYLDATPTHSYLRMLYKYPHAEYPYDHLVAENRARGHDAPEFELIDTGIFNENRYFDVFVDYAKSTPDDILMRIEIINRGPDPAPLHIAAQLFSRNTWSWAPDSKRPLLRATESGIVATHPDRPPMRFTPLQQAELGFCENETNVRRLYNIDTPGTFKDGINDWLVHGNTNAINPLREGTKCAAVTRATLAPGASLILRYTLQSANTPTPTEEQFDTTHAKRRSEADEFYAALQHDMPSADARAVQRQAFAGMIWSKQFYRYYVRKWLIGDPSQPPPPPERRHGRNAEWGHLDNADIISMPDKWEYPWYAAWDLAFHTVVLARIDPEFAKNQLILLTREWYMHPNGQLPAYEWAFGDVNPPVHAWATWRVYQADAALTGRKDREFLERVFHKLMLNFTWWVNRKDADGRNIFEGGFLGLDNIGVFDRSRPLPTGGHISQSDGTAWMAAYTLDLMRIALELAVTDPVYEDIATKFFEHFLFIAGAMTAMGSSGLCGEEGLGLWDEQDQFYYDVLNLPDGRAVPMRLRSLVGLIPLCAVAVLDADTEARFPAFFARATWMLEHRPDLSKLVSRWTEPGMHDRLLLSLLRGHRIKALLRRMLDETEFLSDHGIRSLSRAYAATPYVLALDGQKFTVAYEPGESRSTLFGGNSNWRGPVWLPINYLLVEALREFGRYYGTDFRVECPTNSGHFISLAEIADEIATRLTRLVLLTPENTRPVLGDDAKLQSDPLFANHIPFHEYFHGDSGRGVGASHQTGWTGLLALLLQP